MQRKDVVTVGACIIDACLVIHNGNVHARLHKEDCEVCFHSGEKIQVDTCDFMLGGNACNVSVGLARLGLSAAVMAEIGDDEFSLKILNGLARENVDRMFVKQTKGATCSFAIALEVEKERTIFVSHVPRAHNFQFEHVDTEWIYLTSMGREWKEVYGKVVELVKEKKIKLAFNPGSPQFADGIENFLNVLQVTDVLIVNKKEAQKIIQKEEEDLKKLSVQLQALGPKIVSISDGANGSFAANGDSAYQLGILASNVVAKTGAGDAYASGFLAALVKNLPLAEAMRWGGVNAAGVVGHVGAQTGLLKKETLEKQLSDHPEFQPKEL